MVGGRKNRNIGAASCRIKRVAVVNDSAPKVAQIGFLVLFLGAAPHPSGCFLLLSFSIASFSLLTASCVAVGVCKDRVTGMCGCHWGQAPRLGTLFACWPRYATAKLYVHRSLCTEVCICHC